MFYTYHIFPSFAQWINSRRATYMCSYFELGSWLLGADKYPTAGPKREMDVSP